MPPTLRTDTPVKRRPRIVSLYEAYAYNDLKPEHACEPHTLQVVSMELTRGLR